VKSTTIREKSVGVKKVSTQIPKLPSGFKRKSPAKGGGRAGILLKAKEELTSRICIRGVHAAILRGGRLKKILAGGSGAKKPTPRP